MLRRPRSDPPDESGPRVLRLVLAALLGLTIGWGIFNQHSILTYTHDALALHSHSKVAAFRTFMGLPEHEITGSTMTSTVSTTPPPSLTQAILQSSAAQRQETAQQKQQDEEKKREQQRQQEQQRQLEAEQERRRQEELRQQQQQSQQQGAPGASPATQAGAQNATERKRVADASAVLSTRVCGSPAIDGYAHVVPKCLEESPTNKWWIQYYKSGGKQKDLVVHIEEKADYDGLAVKWGLGNTVKDARECADQCLNHMPRTIPGPFTNLPCNAFAFCPDDVCFEPDAHSHHKGDCWLKFTEGPAWVEINMRGILPEDYLKRHPNAPRTVQWISGVLLPPGVKPSNGTWGPRWKW